MNLGKTNYTEMFSAIAEAIDQQAVVGHLISTLILLVSLFVLRTILAGIIRRQENVRQELRRRWLVALRNGTVLMILLGVVLIWAHELRTVAVYAFAIAVATVIATKELIQCVTGSVMRTAGAFHIGDRIEIGDFRGDVIDHNLLTTTIMEVGPDGLTHRLTGRAISLPNSMFLADPVTNETYTDDYVLHVFKVPMKQDDDWQQAEHDLLCAAREQCSKYVAEARSHFDKLSHKEGLTVFNVEPHVIVQVPTAGNVELVVRMATPARNKGKIEQAILRKLLVSIKQRAAEKAAANNNANAGNDAMNSPSQ